VVGVTVGFREAHVVVAALRWLEVLCETTCS
jgi:hypothetical protein